MKGPGRQGYPAVIRERARKLTAAGWNNTEVSRMISRETKGHFTPQRNTIRAWTDEDYAETERMRRLTGKPIGGPRRKTWRMRLDRIVELAGLGISCVSVAAVVCHDFDLKVSGEQVRLMLRGEMPEPTIRGLLYPKGAGE